MKDNNDLISSSSFFSLIATNINCPTSLGRCMYWRATDIALAAARGGGLDKILHRIADQAGGGAANFRY